MPEFSTSWILSQPSALQTLFYLSGRFSDTFLELRSQSAYAVVNQADKLTHRRLCEEGYRKFPDGLFRVPNVDRWNVMATGHALMDEIASAPENELSFYNSINEV
jgi:hypothetical protein